MKTIKDLILNRRTVHQFTAEPIDENILRDALQTCIYAPNHKLTNPWRFTLVGAEARDRLAELSVEIKQKKEDKPLTMQMQDALRRKVLTPYYLIVPSLVICDDPMQAREDYAAMSCAMQNLFLFLWDVEIGTKWSTGKLTTHANTYEWLKIDKTKEEIVGFIWIGRVERMPPKLERPNLSEIFRRIP